MKRNDAKEVFDIPNFNKIFPFMMKRRCDALVFQTLNLDMTRTVEFVRQYNKEHPEAEFRMKVFYVFIAAMMRLIAVRPELNRFIANYKYWQRNELSVNFVIKESFTDDAPEHSSPIVVRPDAILPEIARQVDDTINEARSAGSDDQTDNAIRFFTRFPNWVVNLVVSTAGWLDKKGKAPAILRMVDGLHTSLYISNLGSIGLMAGATQHHLYEWGTTSIFLTLGALNRRITFEEDGTTVKKYEMTVGSTVDERITDGFYFVKSYMMLQDFLLNPEILMERPELPPPIKTKKEYYAMVKEQKRARKRQMREERKVRKERARSNGTSGEATGEGKEAIGEGNGEGKEA